LNLKIRKNQIFDFMDFWIFFGFGFGFWIFEFFGGFMFPIQIQSKNPIFFGFKPLITGQTDMTSKQFFLVYFRSFKRFNGLCIISGTNGKYKKFQKLKKFKSI
jgi:hypothetical protein